MSPTGTDRLFGLHPLEAADGTVRGSMPTGTPYVDEAGLPSVGALGVLVDEVLGTALGWGLPGTSSSVSTEIWIDLVAPLPEDGSPLHALGRLVRSDGTSSFAAGELLDAGGAVVALCRQRGRAVPAGPGAVLAQELALPTGARTTTDLLGLQVTGPTEAGLMSTPVLANPSGMLHGGVSLCASEVLAVHARRAETATGLVTTSVHIVHTRGVPGGVLLELHAQTRHAGRTLRVDEVTGRVAGRVVTTATVTAGPPWS